ncbi:ParA family protein [Polymorphospora sp. NPDC050346]|uniref:ParA family protein n=1 Tax=Polymorphospora sp. NPDC050346 TaxID=3155780 RepID=UPI0033D9065B
MYDVLRELGVDNFELRWDPRTETIVLIVFSEKGGVGKTALVVALATVMAENGKTVLVIDLDPRATATNELGIDTPEWSVNDLLYIDPDDPAPVSPRGLAAQAILPSGEDWPDNIHVLAAERALGHRESDQTPGMENRLALALEGVAEKYHLVLIDVPPRPGGKLVAAAVQAATHALLPGTLEEDGYIGVRDAVVSIRRSRLTNGRPLVPIVGVLRNIVDRRKTGITDLYDEKFGQEWPANSTARCDDCQKTPTDPVTCPHVPRLIDGAAVPKYVVRQESRAARVPFTGAGTPEAARLQQACVKILNHISEVA